MIPTLLPLGDRALLVRYSDSLSDEANRAAVALGHALTAEPIAGVAEVAPGLVSVLLRAWDGADLGAIRTELMLRLGGPLPDVAGRHHRIDMTFDGADLDEVCAQLGMSRGEFVARHDAEPLRVLATGFAPGFVYCGFHAGDLMVPRREAVRPMVPAGTVLFAAGQTAIAATPIRTGWHLIGRTTFQNFDPGRSPATVLVAGDMVEFRGVA